MDIKLDLLPSTECKMKPADESALGFGRLFTDHMFMMDYDAGQGWHSPRIACYQPIVLDPAALIFHYGQEVFEGLKAYLAPDGCIYMFRPRDNMLRMNRSNARVCIPELPVDFCVQAMMELVRVERDWVPASAGTSLYIRPTVIATEACLGVKVSSKYLFYVIMGPVGAYYPEGFNPVKIYVEEKYVRAAIGGTGEAKTMGNYACSLLAAEEAHAKGFTQVLWLDACDRKSIEEVGTMNMFFKIDDEVITSPLTGSILPGITRDSVLTLCRHWGLKVSERKLTIDEVLEAQKSGKLQEAFGTGTAAVVSPVGLIHYRGTDYQVADGGTGPLAHKLYDEITGIQLGAKPDPFGWVVKVC
ncbi:MAG: branched-chain amino acid aminotransferase [Deltaproteobacteria bacterium]|nr:branched-chain amino acid aminotransferase [Deltaproteobacteria bacterium]